VTATSTLNGALSALRACWRQTAEHLRESHGGVSPQTADAPARRAVEDVAFFAACRQRGLVPDLPPERLRQWAASHFGPALFQLQPDENGHAAQQAGQAQPGALAALDSHRLGPDSLGEIHHRLLGLRQQRDANGRVRAGRSPATAKASGVFYTPRYVTECMVARAVESLQPAWLKDRGAIPPRIIDPACGCGAFLLAAYRHLRDATSSSKPRGDRGCRRQIIERLHGVDLDADAVLAARRALWLETADEPAGPLSPDDTAVMFDTIRAGNSLAGPTLDPLIGTFDLVLGNPPYRRELGAKARLDRIGQTELGRRWRTARIDLWYYFAHRAIELLREDGILSLITSVYWTAGSGAAKLIEQLRRETHVEEIVDLDRLCVFDRVAGRHMILRARKTRRGRAATIIRSPRHGEAASAEAFLAGQSPSVEFAKTADELFHDGRIDLAPVAKDLLAALAQGTPLGRLGRVRQGIAENPATVNPQTLKLLRDAHAGDGVFVLAPEEVDSLDVPDEERSLLRPYHRPCDVGRYRLAEQPSRTLIYSTAETCPDVRAFPAIERHLARFRPIMEARRETRLGRRGWWQLHWPRDESLWTADKILSVQMARRPSFAAARGPVYVSFSVNVFVPDRSTREKLFYFAAVLNSSVLAEWFRHHAKRRGAGLEINGHVLAQAPIRRIDFALAADRRIHDELVELAGEMSRVRACTHQGNSQEAAERRIDALVSQLYGLRDLRAFV